MTFKPYPKYKASGVEWLGDVPDGWGAKALKHCVEIPITDGPHETPAFVDSGMQFISAEAIKNSKIDFEKRRGFITTELFLEYSKKCTPRRDDIFMVKSGNTTGTFAIVETDEAFAIWSPLALIRVDPRKFSPKFVYYNFAADFFQENVKISCSYGTQPNIGMGVIEGLVVSVPPLIDQQNIATFLDRETAKIDTLIAKQEAMIDLLKEKRQAVISIAVTKGLDPSVPMKASGVEWLGDVPELWTICSFRHCASIAEGQVDPKSDEFRDVVLLAPNHIESGTGRIIFTETAVEQEAISGKYQVKAGDVVYSKIRPSLNKVCIANDDCLCSADMYPIRTGTNLTANYLHALMLSAGFVKLMSEESARVAMPKVNRETVTACKLPLPSIEEQNSIVTYLGGVVGRIDTLIAKAQQAIALQKEHRTALISAAVTGKIDVRGWAEERKAA